MSFNRVAIVVTTCLLFSGALGTEAQEANKPLTNADVIKMVNAGVPESAIVSSIQTSGAKFDTSPEAMHSLRKAGASQKIVDTVVARGQSSFQPANEVAGRSRKSNPKRDASEPLDASSKEAIKKKLETQYAAFRNTVQTVHEVKKQAEAKKAPEIDALERQKNFVATLRSSSLKPSGTLLSGSASTMSASGGMLSGRVGTSAVSPAAAKTSSTSVAAPRTLLATSPTEPSERQAPTSAAQHQAATTPNITATQPVLAATPQLPSERQAPASAAQHQSSTSFPIAVTQPVLATGPQLPSERQAPTSSAQYQPAATLNPRIAMPVNATICTTAQIYSVNNATSGAVFTQDPAYNDYFISGRCFGNQGGEVYLSGAITGGRINMVVKQWGSSQIEAVVQPGLTGVLDGWPDLIVVPAGSTPIKFSNNRFYAQRQSVLLPSIPLNYAHMANVQVGDSTHGFGTHYCPGPDVTHLFPCISFNAGPPLDGISNGDGIFPGPNEPVSNAVDRDGGQLQFNAGEDVYDLSSLAPGFVIDHFSPSWYAWSASVCAGWQAEGSEKPGDSISYETNGTYGFYQKGSKIVVDWGVDHCKWRWLGMFNVDDEYNSGYSLQVYVKGPIGIDPWTGQAISN